MWVLGRTDGFPPGTSGNIGANKKNWTVGMKLYNMIRSRCKIRNVLTCLNHKALHSYTLNQCVTSNIYVNNAI